MPGVDATGREAQLHMDDRATTATVRAAAHAADGGNHCIELSGGIAIRQTTADERAAALVSRRTGAYHARVKRSGDRAAVRRTENDPSGTRRTIRPARRRPRPGADRAAQPPSRDCRATTAQPLTGVRQPHAQSDLSLERRTTHAQGQRDRRGVCQGRIRGRCTVRGTRAA